MRLVSLIILAVIEGSFPDTSEHTRKIELILTGVYSLLYTIFAWIWIVYIQCRQMRGTLLDNGNINCDNCSRYSSGLTARLLVELLMWTWPIASVFIYQCKDPSHSAGEWRHVGEVIGIYIGVLIVSFLIDRIAGRFCEVRVDVCCDSRKMNVNRSRCSQPEMP